MRTLAKKFLHLLLDYSRSRSCFYYLRSKKPLFDAAPLDFFLLRRIGLYKNVYKTHLVYQKSHIFSLICCSVLFLMLSISESFCQNNIETMRELYDKGEYEKAAQMALMNDGIAHRFYNAAICYTALKRYPQAEGYLLLELKADPSFTAARTLLREVAPTSSFKSNYREKFILWCKTHSAIIPAFLCMLPIFLFLLWSLYLKQSVFERSLAIALIFTLSMTLSYLYLLNCKIFIPLGEEGILRTGPSTNHANLSALDLDYIYEIEQQDNDWLQVSASNGKRGWIRSSEGISL